MAYHDADIHCAIPCSTRHGQYLADLVGDLSQVLNRRDDYGTAHACAKHALLNRIGSQWNRANQAVAMQATNSVRAALLAGGTTLDQSYLRQSAGRRSRAA